MNAANDWTIDNMDPKIHPQVSDAPGRRAGRLVGDMTALTGVVELAASGMLGPVEALSPPPSGRAAPDLTPVRIIMKSYGSQGLSSCRCVFIMESARYSSSYVNPTDHPGVLSSDHSFPMFTTFWTRQR